MASNPISLAIAFIAAEILLISIAIVIYLIVKNRNSHSVPVSALEQRAADVSAQAGQSSVDHGYWLNEIKKTRDVLLARDEGAINNTENIDYVALNLRLQLLELEHKTAQIESDKRSIDSIELDINKILKRFQIMHALNMLHEKHVGQNNNETKDLIEHQKKTIEFLKKFTQDVLSKILNQNKEFMDSQKNREDIEKLGLAHNEFLHMTESFPQKIDQLERINIELSQYIAVLEDENEFLRDQIAALLVIPETGST